MNNHGNVRTERTTSHGEENYFGNIRYELNDSLDTDLFLSVMARIIVKKNYFIEIIFVKFLIQKKNLKISQEFQHLKIWKILILMFAI